MISSRSLMVNGQDKLVQGGEGEKGGGGRDEVFLTFVAVIVVLF